MPNCSLAFRGLVLGEIFVLSSGACDCSNEPNCCAGRSVPGIGGSRAAVARKWVLARSLDPLALPKRSLPCLWEPDLFLGSDLHYCLVFSSHSSSTALKCSKLDSETSHAAASCLPKNPLFSRTGSLCYSKMLG